MAELKIEQDALRDTVTINGIVYARAVFEDFGATMPLGRTFRLVSRENNVLTIEYLPDGVPACEAPSLTDEQIEQLANEAGVIYPCRVSRLQAINFARAVLNAAGVARLDGQTIEPHTPTGEP
jgi:hypothetical protein